MNAQRIVYGVSDGRLEGFEDVGEVRCVWGGAIDDGVAAVFDASETIWGGKGSWLEEKARVEGELTVGFGGGGEV